MYSDTSFGSGELFLVNIFLTLFLAMKVCKIREMRTQHLDTPT